VDEATPHTRVSLRWRLAILVIGLALIGLPFSLLSGSSWAAQLGSAPVVLFGAYLVVVGGDQ
jgi:hypothetical protein